MGVCVGCCACLLPVLSTIFLYLLGESGGNSRTETQGQRSIVTKYRAVGRRRSEVVVGGLIVTWPCFKWVWPSVLVNSPG